jgi:clan AA aspartic protease (TIGR02281 family)
VLLLVGTVVLALAAAAGGLYFRRAQRLAALAEIARKASEPEPFEYGIAAENIERLRAIIAKEPCDRARILDLANAVIQAGDARGSLFHANAFFKKCGDYPRLRWITYEAHKQLSEWPLALADASLLIESDPNDADYRGWRGLVNDQMGQLEPAAQDYRQALMLRPQLRDVPLNLANIYERQGKPCEAILPLAQLVFYAGNVVDPSPLRSRILQLEARPECSWSVGEGQVQIRRAPGQNVFTAQVRINDKVTGTFVVDTGATFVALNRTFAEKLQLDLTDAPPFLVQTANGVAAGTGVVLEKMSVRGLHASRVPAALVSGLGDIDGLLGMSFLTRFELLQTGDSLQISTRKR